jgi:hypothetical protein
MGKIYDFFFTPANRGVGTGNLALAKPSTNPIQSIYGARYNVQMCLATTLQGGAMQFVQKVPIVPIEGNGSFLQGQMALQSLLKEKEGGSNAVR